MIVVSQATGQILRILSVTILWALLSSGTGQAESAETEKSIEPTPVLLDPAVFESFADELLEQLDRTVDRTSDHPVKIAIQPFNDEETPVGSGGALFNEELLAALIRRADEDDYTFMARADLGALMEELAELGTTNSVNAMLRDAQMDVLIFGVVEAFSDVISLRYKALGADFQVKASTSSHMLPLDPAYMRPNNLYRLDAAISVAARDLANQAGDLSRLSLAGIRFANTGVQTEFGRYIQDGLAEVLKRAVANAITGRKLTVHSVRLAPEKIKAMRGIELSANDLKPEQFEPFPGSYILTGRYWDFAPHFSLVISLYGKDGQSVGWKGFIDKSSIPIELRTHPPGDFGVWRENDGIGPIEFTLTSDRGVDPAYKVGDKLNLLIRTNRDTWLYCFYRDVVNNVFLIFPNAFHIENWIQGGRLHTIPGEVLPFELKFGEPAGVELIKCYAFERDVADQLPAEFRQTAFEPLPRPLGNKVPELLGAITKAGRTEASLVVSVSK